MVRPWGVPPPIQNAPRNGWMQRPSAAQEASRHPPGRGMRKVRPKVCPKVRPKGLGGLKGLEVGSGPLRVQVRVRIQWLRIPKGLSNPRGATCIAGTTGTTGVRWLRLIWSTLNFGQIVFASRFPARQQNTKTATDGATPFPPGGCKLYLP